MYYAWFLLSALIVSGDAFALRAPPPPIQLPGGGVLSPGPTMNLPSINMPGNAPVPVNLPGNSVNMNQLQTIFNQNPNVSQFAFRFANGANWNVDSNSLLSLFTNYVQQAASLGFRGGNLPNLSFSPLNSTPTLGNGGITLPINGAVNELQTQIRGLLDQINYEKYHLAAYLPDWLKQIITCICVGAGILWDTAVDLMRKWL
jgi:hypothetical protein